MFTFSNLFSSVFGKTNKRKHRHNKKFRQTKRRNLRLMKGG